MSDTMWFNKQPGDVAGVGVDDPTALLIADVPDWVRLPPDLGGQQVRVTEGFAAPCPMCSGAGDVKHLRTTQGICVAECSKHGFVWYRNKGQ